MDDRFKPGLLCHEALEKLSAEERDRQEMLSSSDVIALQDRTITPDTPATTWWPRGGTANPTSDHGEALSKIPTRTLDQSLAEQRDALREYVRKSFEPVGLS